MAKRNHTLTITVSYDKDDSTTRIISFNRISDGTVEPPVDGDSAIVYKTKSGSKYHQDGCSSLSSRKNAINITE